jgi:hypothetical protein
MSLNTPTNSKGEIVDCQEANQFQRAKTQFACGFFSVAMARSMTRPGTPPSLSVGEVIADGLSYYRAFDGTDAISNTNGMTDQQLWTLLHEVGLHYQETSTEASVLKQWLRTGYPVIVALTETSVFDVALNENPYPWHAAGTHIIVLTGISSRGNFLVRDSANCTDLNNPNSLRPGPREYDASRLQVVSATVAVPPWMPRPASATPPAEPPIQVLSNLSIPKGWIDDGVFLKAPNGIPVTGDFRVYVLTHTWDPGNHPVAVAAPANPVELAYQQPDGNNAGTRQLFWYTELAATSSRAVYKVSIGRELAMALQHQATATMTPESVVAPIVPNTTNEG